MHRRPTGSTSIFDLTGALHPLLPARGNAQRTKPIVVRAERRTANAWLPASRGCQPKACVRIGPSRRCLRDGLHCVCDLTLDMTPEARGCHDGFKRIDRKSRALALRLEFGVYLHQTWSTRGATLLPTSQALLC